MTVFAIQKERARTSSLKPRIKLAPVSEKIILEQNSNYTIELIRPLQTRQSYPTIIYIPGTAFSMNETMHTDMICSQIIYKAQYQMLIVRHPLAPEKPFPHAFNILEDTIIDIVKHKAKQYLMDEEKILLMGYSSGGNLAAALAPIFIKNDLPLKTLYLISPILDFTRSVTEYRQAFENKDKIISEDFVNWLQSLYVPIMNDATNPKISPFFIDEQDMAYLPRVELFYGQFDRFRGDAEGYYQKLKAYGAAINKHMIYQSDHSYLWVDINAINRIANNIRDLHWFI